MLKYSFLFTITILIGYNSALAQPINIRVSADSVDVYQPQEVSIAIDPHNPLRLAIGSNGNWIFTSSDAGNTWLTARFHPRFGGGGDPSLVFDNSGYLYYATLQYSSIGIVRSSDGGITFDTGAHVGIDTTVQDKPTLIIDHGGSGTIALGWTRFAHYPSQKYSDSSHILVSLSHDNGLNWLPAVRVDDVGGDCLDSSNTAEGAVPAFGSNGEMYIVWSARDSIFFHRSMDGGLTFGKDRTIAFQPNGWTIFEKEVERANGLPTICSDQSSGVFSGNLYVVWTDTRTGVPDAYFVRSTDHGETWSSPYNLTLQDTSHHLFPTMTVDPTTGHIFIAYYSIDKSRKDSTDVFLATSFDGGVTFKTIKVSKSAFVANNFLGDYMSIIAFNRHIYPVWVRNESIVRTSIWTALVQDTVSSSVVDENLSASSVIHIIGGVDPVIILSLPESSNVNIQIFDNLGRACSSIQENFSSGEQHIELGRNFSHGVYLARIFTLAKIYLVKFVL